MKKNYLFCFLFLVTAQVFATDGLSVKSSEYGDKWPFTVKTGRLACLDGRSVIFISKDKKYAVNGTAKSRGYLPIESIWRNDPEMIKMQKDIAKAEKKSLKEIQKIMGPTPRINIGPILNAGLKLCK